MATGDGYTVLRRLILSCPIEIALGRRMIAIASIATVIAGSLNVSARSQPAATEKELERISKELAIGSVSSSALRWSPTQFPLRVSFASGENLKKKSNCPDQWQRQYEQYLKFINERQSLLKSVLITNELDAYAFFGSVAELEALPAYRLEETWTTKLGVSFQFRWQDRYSNSYQMGYGVGEFMQFGSAFIDLSSEHLDRCIASASIEYFSLALLQAYAVGVTNQILRLFRDRSDPTLEWRAHRRLLAAMKQLPDGELGNERLTTLLIEALSRD
jgi:hypothetical protein